MPLTEKKYDFDPSFRLHYPKEYRKFFHNSEVFRLSECTIYRIQNDLGHFRLGITIKARGLSVNRNKVKRLIREAFRTHKSQLGHYDYNIVIPSSKKLAYPYPKQLAECLRGRFFDKTLDS